MEGQDSSRRAAAMATIKPAMPPKTARRMLSVRASEMIWRGVAPMARRTAVCASPGDGAGKQKIGNVGAGDQQNETADGERMLRRAAVLFLHHGDAGAGRHDRDVLLRQQANHIGDPVGRITGVMLQPLAKHAGQARAHARRRGARLQATDDAQPGGDRLANQRSFAGHHEVLLQRHPNIGGIAFEGFAVKTRRSDADDGERMAFQDEGGAEDGGVAAVGGLPRAMAEDGNRCRRGLDRLQE